MHTITIDYNSSVYTAAGWRHVKITARAHRVSAGMAEVVEVLSIDGGTPKGTMSRTGANRQKYHGTGVALREVGARKRLSACQIVAE